MKKFLKWAIAIVVILGVLLFAAFKIMQTNTKRFSPEEEIEFVQGDLEIEIFYNRPYKKDRRIFGGLVPYGEVWRTGANEATTFETNQEILVKGKSLDPGEYTLWTIPGPRIWQVIFNSKQYRWGVNWDGIPSREPKYDVINVSVPVEQLAEPVEQFTISLEDGSRINLRMAWDKTEINVPIEKPAQ